MQNKLTIIFLFGFSFQTKCAWLSQRAHGDLGTDHYVGIFDMPFGSNARARNKPVGNQNCTGRLKAGLPFHEALAAS